jgi:hypothetical protein
VLRHTLLSSLLACAFVTPSGIPWFHNDVTHFVVVDPLKQPLASKSDRRPVGTLHTGSYRAPQDSSSEDDFQELAEAEQTPQTSVPSTSFPQQVVLAQGFENNKPEPNQTFDIYEPIHVDEPNQPEPEQELPENPPIDMSVNVTTLSTTEDSKNGGGLRGTSPTPFTGDRDQSTQFKREMLRYIKLNTDHKLIKEYYSRVLYCLTLFKGPTVMLWVNEVEDSMERDLANHTLGLTKDSQFLWNQFLDAFDRDWTDSLTKEKAYSQLITLKMQPGQLDEYILTFENLAGIAGWSRNAPGTVEFFKRGLVPGVFRTCLMRSSIPDTMDDWQRTTRTETQRYKLIKAGIGARPMGPTQSTSNNRPRPRDPNAMEVDATNTAPFKKMTEEECQRHMKEGHCFKCHQQGHMARECPKKSLRFQAKARATDTKEAEEAPPSYPSGGSSSIAASTSEDKVQVAHAMVQAMNDEEKRRYYALDQDFYDADL